MRFVNEIFQSPILFGLWKLLGVVTHPQVVFAVAGEFGN
jgi:hypothetical protein